MEEEGESLGIKLGELVSVGVMEGWLDGCSLALDVVEVVVLVVELVELVEVCSVLATVVL